MSSLVAEFPLDWPDGWEETPPHERLRSMAGGHGHTPSWDSVLERLRRELTRMGASSVILSTNQPVRLDGNPYASRRKIEDPGVAVYFTYQGKDLVIAQDRYKLLTDNIRSLCIQIEGLRMMERHGGGIMLERAFRGFERLPPPEQARSWRAVFGIDNGSISLGALKQIYRRLAAERHPDKSGGSVEQMQALNRAYADAKQELGHRHEGNHRG